MNGGINNAVTEEAKDAPLSVLHIYLLLIYPPIQLATLLTDVETNLL